MKKYNDIEDLYKEMFSDYSPEPPAKVWENIQAAAAAHSGKKSSLWKKITFPIVGVVVVSVIVSLFMINSKQNESVMTAQDAKQPIEETKINSEPSNVETVSDLSANTYSSVPQQTHPADDAVETKSQTVEHVQPVNHFDNNHLPTMQSGIVSTPFVADDKTDKKDTNLSLTIPPVKQIQQQHPEKITQNKKQLAKTIRISKDTTVCEHTPVQLYAYNVENVRWSTGETQNLITVYPSYDELYSLTFTNENMKDSTVHIQVRVIECPDVFVPNAFTPNGDGLNDIFLVKTKMELTSFEMSIYASNGKQLLFTSKDIHQGWDGIYRGEIQPHGLYFYTIRYTDTFGRHTEKRGELLLILQ
jgi:gliding motility-associated-like protein